jgi:hypothetical protein
MDRAFATARTLWTTLQPDLPGIVAIVIAILTMILVICIGLNIAVNERQWIKQEGMVGGMGSTYPGSGGLYPLTRAELTAAVTPATITLYSDPHGHGQPLTPPSCLLTLPVIENVPYDARWLTSRAGWSYGPMSGLYGLVGIGNPTP